MNTQNMQTQQDGISLKDWSWPFWPNQVASWDFQRIIPCHLDSPIEATPTQFRQAFVFLEKTENPPQSLPEEDLEFLNELSQGLSKWGITPPAKERV
jgi:hypothetical protein